MPHNNDDEPTPDEATHERNLDALPHTDDRPAYDEPGWHGAFLTDDDCPQCDVGVVIVSNTRDTPDDVSTRSCSAGCGYSVGGLPT